MVISRKARRLAEQTMCNVHSEVVLVSGPGVGRSRNTIFVLKQIIEIIFKKSVFM